MLYLNVNVIYFKNMQNQRKEFVDKCFVTKVILIITKMGTICVNNLNQKHVARHTDQSESELDFKIVNIL